MKIIVYLFLGVYFQLLSYNTFVVLTSFNYLLVGSTSNPSQLNNPNKNLTSIKPIENKKDTLKVLENGFIEITNNLNLEMVYIKGSKLSLGNTFKEYVGGELLYRFIHVDNFLIGKYEITQAQWSLVMGDNPSYFKCDSCPVENVSWVDVQIFIKILNIKTKKSYRLPSEVEWEFASRGGVKSINKLYSGSNEIKNVCWYKKTSNKRTHPVGLLRSNELGIFDMSGNVWEWCNDWYKSDFLEETIIDSKVPIDAKEKVLRGGSWYNGEKNCSVYYRIKCYPGHKSSNIGFRLVLSP